jgi:hypothetical protein
MGFTGVVGALSSFFFLALLVFLGVNMSWVQFAQISDESPRFTA